MAATDEGKIPYYSEGNMTIRCKTSDGAASYFRIHRHFICSWSSVISDMLSSGEPFAPENTYEGTPLVELNKDPREMEKFLLSLYNAFSKFRREYLSDADPDVAFKLYEVLDLVQMLKIAPLKARIITRIKRDWPPILDRYDDRIAFYDLKNQDKPEDYRFPDPASVIRVGRLFEPSLLSPLVFYELCSRDHLRGFGEAAGKYDIGLRARWDIITRDEIHRAERGRRRILDWLVKELTLSAVSCVAPNPIAFCTALLTRRTYQVRIDVLARKDPLRALLFALGRHRDEGFDDLGGTTCEECDYTWAAWIKGIRTKLFAQLSDFFPSEEQRIY